MSFSGYKTIIEEGDMVILYFSRESASYITVTEDGQFNNKFGLFRHKDMIGCPYGLKLSSFTGKGFVYLLHPTPELWTMVVPHRTQIIYTTDIAFITSYLDLKPGSKVIESGTGSGSFSHSFARTLGPTGHLYTFEYHKERSETASAEFKAHKIDHIITVQNRDVCKEGFGMTNAVDAVFLDLPAPWEAVNSAKEALKTNCLGRICTFSPCIEQVQRSCIALQEAGFTDIKTFECLTRGYEFNVVSMSTLEETKNKLNENILKRKAAASGLDTNHNSESKDEKTPRTNNSRVVTKPVFDMRGHTSYLTFAILPPQFQSSTLPVVEPVKDKDIE